MSAIEDRIRRLHEFLEALDPGASQYVVRTEKTGTGVIQCSIVREQIVQEWTHVPEDEDATPEEWVEDYLKATVRDLLHEKQEIIAEAEKRRQEANWALKEARNFATGGSDVSLEEIQKVVEDE